MTTHEIVTDAVEFTRLQDDWNEFWRRAHGAVFQSHSWISAWLQGDPDARKWRLHLAVARRDGRIAAILPMAIRRYHGVRVLEFAAQRFSDYCDGIGPPDLLQALWSKIIQQGGFDVVRLRNVAPDAATRPAFASAPLSFLSEAEDEISLRLRSVWPNGDAWLRTLNKKKRSNNARGRRILAELGDVTIERFDRTIPVEVVSQLADLKRKWLLETKARSALLDHGPGLLAAFAGSLAKVDRLYAFVVRCNGEIVAGAINAIHGKCVWAYFSAYDSRFHRVSPGILLMTEYTQRALDDGFQEVDYLRGNEIYKFEFATAHVQSSRFTGAVTLLGRLALSATRLQTALQRRRAGQSPKAAEELATVGSAYVTKNGASRIASADPLSPRVPAFSDVPS
jgi:CelD/BcsL family acetyltransferase involved in cellulose biosynthesis